MVKPKPLNVSNTTKEGGGHQPKKPPRNVHTDGIPKDSWDSLQLRNPAVYPKGSSLVKWQNWTYISPYIHKPKADQRKYSNKKIHPRSVNIFQYLSWLQYDSKFFINIKYACWWMSLMQIKCTLNVEIISYYLARMHFFQIYKTNMNQISL